MKKNIVNKVNNILDTISKLEEMLDTKTVIGTSGKLKKLLRAKWQLFEQKIENENNHF